MTFESEFEKRFGMPIDHAVIKSQKWNISKWNDEQWSSLPKFNSQTFFATFDKVFSEITNDIINKKNNPYIFDLRKEIRKYNDNKIKNYLLSFDDDILYLHYLTKDDRPSYLVYHRMNAKCNHNISQHILFEVIGSEFRRNIFTTIYKFIRK